MQSLKATIKKIGALASGALMIGATVGMAAAFDLSNFPSPFVSGGNVASQIVVGSAAQTADVVGGIQIAERLGNLAIKSEEKTASAAVSGTSVSVSKGVSLDTANTKLYFGDSTNTARQTLTKSDLPEILKSGSLSVSGTEYKYDQYISVGSKTITFGNSGESIDPILYVDVGTSASSPLYTTQVVFNKALNVSSSRVQGKSITLFGKQYTIGSGSDYNTLVLYGAGVTDQFTHGQDKTVTVGGTEYTLKTVIDTSGNVAIYVNGVTDGSTYAAGESTVIGGLNIYVKSVMYASTTDLTQNYATLSLGSEKLTLNSGDAVKVGESETSIDGTLVTITGTSGTGISKISIKVAAKDSTGDYIAKDKSFTDPVFGSFKVAFGGLAPDLTASSRDQVYLGVSGNNAATLKFKDYRGNEKQLIIAYDNDTATGTVTPILADTNKNIYHVVEGDAVSENQYVLLSQGGFSHVFKVTDISSVGTSNAKVVLQDQMSGDTTTIYLEAPGYTNATTYIDGMTYYVNATSTAVKFTWNADSTDSATFGDAGNITTVFPLLKGNNGELITFLNNASKTFSNGGSTGKYYEFPGGSAGTTIAKVSNATTSVTAGRLTYYFTPGSTTSTLANISGVTLTAYPMVLLLEEKGKNSAGADVRDAIIAKTTSAGTTPAKMAWSSTVTFTDANSPSFKTLISDTYTSKAVDRYGTMVKRYTYDQGSITIYYPDNQAIAAVGIGADPSFTIGGGNTEIKYNQSVPGQIAANAAWLDTEVTPSIKSNNNLILVGGPAINSLVADLAAQPNSSVWNLNTWRDGAHNNMAQIALVENAFAQGKVALVVAGHSADDTRAACKAVANYDVAPFKDKATKGVTEITLTSAEYPS